MITENALTNDGMRSLLGSLGDPAHDKAATGYYQPNRLDDTQLINTYRSSWIARKIVDIPAQDCLRKWRTWSGEQTKLDAIGKLEKDLGLQGKLLRMKTLARLFGGAALYIGTDDKDPAEPFDPRAVRSGGVKYLTVFTRRELVAGELETDPSENFGKPKFYTLANNAEQVRIHPSRLVIQIGAEHPDPRIAGGLVQGWGDSVIESTYDAVRNADGTAGNIASLVFEANVDVIKIPNLMKMLSTEGYESKLMERLTLASANKSINRSLLMDANEDYDRKATTFAQLPDVMQSFLLMVSGAADIPLSRFLGQGAAGMNATGEGDMKNYHDKISSMQSLELEPALRTLDDAILISATGSTDDDVRYAWNPLELMSELEKAEIGSKTADTLTKLSGTGAWMSEEMRAVGTPALVEAGVFPNLGDVVEETEASGDFDLGENEKEPDPAKQAPGEPAEPEQATDAAPTSLYVSRSVENADAIISWALEQGLTDLHPADDLHVTIVHSREPVDWMKVGQSWESRMTIPEGGPRIVETFGPLGNYTVLSFASSELTWRNEWILNHGASSDFPTYQAHISLSSTAQELPATLEPYTGEIVLGPEIFEEVKS